MSAGSIVDIQTFEDFYLVQQPLRNMSEKDRKTHLRER